MKRIVDLHLHSSRSDGVHSPAEVVELAARQGLAAIALADHDTVDGVDEAVETGARLGVEVLPAIELSVEYRTYRDIHLLGYCIDHRDSLFRERLARFREARDSRGRAIVEKINAVLSASGRTPIDLQAVLEQAEGVLGRPHVARVLVSSGYAADMEEAFRNWLVPYDVPKRYFPLEEALVEIRRLGGVAILAHPPSIGAERGEMILLLGRLKALGLDGVETLNTMASEEELLFYRDLARELGLIETGGSDYHAPGGHSQLGAIGRGISIPYSCVEAVRRLADERQKKNATKGDYDILK